MTKTALHLALLAGAFAIQPALAQEAQEAAPPPPCQSDEHFRDFDFWLGSWDVYSQADGALAGRNVIQEIEGGCALLETWRGKGGSSGQSYNFYNPVTEAWRQLWIAPGYSIDYAGGLNAAGQMVLEGEIFYYRQGAKFPFRGTWTPQSDGNVRQLFEQYDPQKEAWVVWFDGLYKPAAAETEAQAVQDATAPQ